MRFAFELFPVLFFFEASSLRSFFPCCCFAFRPSVRSYVRRRPLFEALLLACLRRLVRHAILLLVCHSGNFIDFWFWSRIVLCRTTNRSMLAHSCSEKCAFMLARSSKLSFFVLSFLLEVQIRVRCSEILSEHIKCFYDFTS